MFSNPCPAKPGYILPLQTVYIQISWLEEANWSGSTQFVIQYVNFGQQSGLSNLIGCQQETDVASLFIQHDKG